MGKMEQQREALPIGRVAFAKTMYTQWVAGNSKKILSSVLTLTALCVCAYQVSGRMSWGAGVGDRGAWGKGASPLSVDRAFENWISQETQDLKTFQLLEKPIRQHPELQSKFGTAIAQRLVALGEVKEAEKYASAAFKRSHDLNSPYYSDFSKNTLMISAGKFQEELHTTFEQLKTELIGALQAEDHDTVLRLLGKTNFQPLIDRAYEIGRALIAHGKCRKAIQWMAEADRAHLFFRYCLQRTLTSLCHDKLNHNNDGRWLSQGQRDTWTDKQEKLFANIHSWVVQWEHIGLAHPQHPLMNEVLQHVSNTAEAVHLLRLMRKHYDISPEASIQLVEKMVDQAIGREQIDLAKQLVAIIEFPEDAPLDLRQECDRAQERCRKKISYTQPEPQKQRPYTVLEIRRGIIEFDEQGQLTKKQNQATVNDFLDLAQLSPYDSAKIRKEICALAQDLITREEYPQAIDWLRNCKQLDALPSLVKQSEEREEISLMLITTLQQMFSTTLPKEVAAIITDLNQIARRAARNRTKKVRAEAIASGRVKLTTSAEKKQKLLNEIGAETAALITHGRIGEASDFLAQIARIEQAFEQ